MDEKQVVVKQRGGFGSMFSGFLIGGLIGAAVALLAAPQSGVETRSMIRDRAENVRDQAMDMADNTMDKAQKVVSNVRDQASDTVQRTIDRVSNITGRSASMSEPEKPAHMGDMGA